jgi:hypothetical protein
MSKKIGANEPAYPCTSEGFAGMTLRQRYVMAAMQGLLANAHPEAWELGPIEIAGCACQYADECLKAEAETRGDNE